MPGRGRGERGACGFISFLRGIAPSITRQRPSPPPPFPSGLVVTWPGSCGLAEGPRAPSPSPAPAPPPPRRAGPATRPKLRVGGQQSRHCPRLLPPWAPVTIVYNGVRGSRTAEARGGLVHRQVGRGMCALRACESWDEVASDAEKLPGLRGGQGKGRAPKGPAPAGWPQPSPTDGEARSGTAAPGPSTRRVGAWVLVGLLRGELLLGPPNPGPLSLAVRPTGTSGQLPKAPGRGGREGPLGPGGAGGVPPGVAGGSPRGGATGAPPRVHAPSSRFCRLC